MPNSQASFEISLRVNAMYGVPVMLVLYILLGFSVACPVDDYTLTMFSDFFFGVGQWPYILKCLKNKWQ